VILNFLFEAWSDTSIIFWDICRILMNCFVNSKNRYIHFSNTFKEGNGCVDKLVESETRSHGCTLWANVLSFVCSEFFNDRFDLPFYRVRD